MTRKPPKVTLRIDRIVTDQPGLEGAALQAALQDAVREVLAAQGAEAFESGGQHRHREATLPEGNSPLHARIAAAAIKAVVS